MTTTEEVSRRNAGNRRRGNTAEQAVARYLRLWWPNACRAVRTGSSAAPDPGDIAGIPGVIVSVKDCAREQWTQWWFELEEMLAGDTAALAVIVFKRRGWADPAKWWVHLYLDDLAPLLDDRQMHHGGHHHGYVGDRTVRMELEDLVDVLRDAGYMPPGATS